MSERPPEAARSGHGAGAGNNRPPLVPLSRALPALAGLLLTAACGPDGPALVDVTGESGVRFRHDNGFRDSYAFPETMGSGVALVDLNGDGELDLYALQGGVVPEGPADGPEAGPRPVNRLFLGRGGGRLEDATERSGDAADPGLAMGVCAGDVDGDGALDLFVTQYGPDLLLQNDGGARFRETAAGTPLADPRWNTACGFADLDADGQLDLVVIGYLARELALLRPCEADGVRDYCDVVLYTGIGDRAWKGDGRGGFEERTEAWGLGGRAGKGLGLALVDLDDDGDVDLYVANDSVENHLYLNRGDGRLEDRTQLAGAAYSVEGLAEAGMGVAVADVDASGLPDLFVTNFAGESNTLYVNRGAGLFRDRSRPSGLTAWSRTPLGFGTTFADFDRDGREDLVVTNGHVLRHLGERRELWTYAQPDQLFRGLAGGRFEPWDAGPDLARPPWGAAWPAATWTATGRPTSRSPARGASCASWPAGWPCRARAGSRSGRGPAAATRPRSAHGCGSS